MKSVRFTLLVFMFSWIIADCELSKIAYRTRHGYVELWLPVEVYEVHF